MTCPNRPILHIPIVKKNIDQKSSEDYNNVSSSFIFANVAASQRAEIIIWSARLKNEILFVSIYSFDQKA